MTYRVLALIIFGSASSLAQEVPLVYDVEHTGADLPAPLLPSFEELPIVRPLPDPFSWSDGSGRSTEFDDWMQRRAEIKSEIEHYGIGKKPPRPEKLTASYKENLLTVSMTVGGETLSLTSQITLPPGEGPFPAVIGIGRGSGSLPSDIFETRGIAQIPFNFMQVMSHTQTRGSEPINRLFPERTEIGAYSAWSWGISRLIDGLELVQDDLPIDLDHLAVTGCSFAGKMALFAGALDERIALTIAQEPGGGGGAAWRVSETLGNVETLGKTSSAWFLEDMFRFANQVAKLPYDHHELMAIVAPRGLLILGNPDYEWLADESGYVSARAAHEVWKQFGIDDRFGFSIVGGHTHCRLPESQRPEVEAFVDKFLLGQVDVNTNVMKHPFADVEYEYWYDGWLTGKSSFPEPDTSNVKTEFFELECASYGSHWKQHEDLAASNDRYLAIESGLNSPQSAPTEDEARIAIPFTIEEPSRYFIFARVNCPTADDDSFWIGLDDRDFVAAAGLRTTDWEWVRLMSTELKAGTHVLTIAYREDGALIDKLAVTNYVYGPTGIGEKAQNCDP